MGYTTKELFERINPSMKHRGELIEEGMDPSISVPRDRFQGIMRMLKEDHNYDFDTLMSQTAVHIEDKLVLYWHLFSYSHRHRVVIQVEVPLDDAKIPSVAQLWKTADWLERETYDLFGVEFEGHPDLRRIMLPEDWVGHPLLKDYEKPRTYGFMDNSPSETTLSFQPKKKGK